MPLVSVIVPCYNHGRYLPEAFESIRRQKYPAIEVILVDDGSTDSTREMAEACPGIKYIYQHNQGLSAARNTGIAHSRGEFLLFLDADDWLLEDAIAVNAAHLMRDEKLAFVSGAHDKVYTDTGIVKEEVQEVTADHYCQLLQGNYIGMHATVMYRRWVFEEFAYDTSLKACEDYDLYLRIARKHPVAHHSRKVAAYRLHSHNMSANIPMMLHTVLDVQRRQAGSLRSAAERNALKRGRAVWKEYYCEELYRKLRQNRHLASPATLATLRIHKPTLFFRYLLKNQSRVLKSAIKKNAPAFSLRWLQKAGLYHSYKPAVGKVEAGDFDRPTPFSTDFGYDRGGPVDRYYIENFLKQESGSIRGNVLEIGDNEYTMMFGARKVTKSDILHVDDTNPKATLVGDLSDAPHLPDNRFDCIILTQTLHLIYDFKGALQTCHRILKPGGVLLLTSPGLSPIDQGAWNETWYWSFTDRALQRVTEETFPGGQVEVNAHGNVYAATAFLYGMGLPEVQKEKLDRQDPQFQVIITVKATKAAS